MSQEIYHEPVLAAEAVDFLVTVPDGIYVDCTLGGAGHSEKVLRKISDRGKLLCLDADADAVRFAEQRLADFPNKIIRQVFYDQLQVVLFQENLLPVHGVLFDLGISSFQVDHRERGFSFQKEGPLDMRFNARQELTAEVVVNEYPPEKLEKILREYGEEKNWRRISRAITEARQLERIRTTTRLAEIVRRVVGAKFQNKSLARVFQAIRIEVNDELNRLHRALEQAFESLTEGGRMVVISYHSLEDRMVKEFFRYRALDCVCPPEFPRCVCDKQAELRIITRKPVRPSPAEVEANPRARSARMRVAEKIVPYREVA